MSAELHLVNRCEHGETGPLGHFYPGSKYGTEDWCDGGSVVVLDPERVLVFSWWSGAKEFQVIDVLDALAQEHT